MAAVETFSDADFEAQVLRSERPVLVEFLAEWCVPCRYLLLSLEATGARHAGRLRVGILDIDHNPGVAGRYAIQGLPTLVLFEAGREVLRRVGLVDPDDLERLVQPRLEHSPS